MNNINPDTYCGIYCGARSVLMHGETGHVDGFTTCLLSVPKEELACGGCKSGTVYAGCRTCSIRDCAVKKGIAHCVDCTDYPCKMYRTWQSASKILPHIREAALSLYDIKHDGVDSWLMAQKKRWSCPDCGAPFSWYAPVCSECGRGLTSEVYKMSGLKKTYVPFHTSDGVQEGKSKK